MLLKQQNFLSQVNGSNSRKATRDFSCWWKRFIAVCSGMATRDHCPPSLRPQGSVQLLPGSAGIQMYIYINKIDPLERDKRVVVQSSSNFFLPVFSSAFCRLFARLIRKINPKESGKVRTHNAIFITSDNIFGICWDVHLAPPFPPLMRPHYFMVGASCSLAQQLSEECVNRNDHRRLGLMPESVALYCAVHPTFIMPFVITLTAVNTGESFYVWDRCGRFARLINHGRSPFMKQSHFIHKG